MRALLLHATANKPLILLSLTNEDIEGTAKLKVSAVIKAPTRQDQLLEELVARLSLEAAVTSVSWAVSASVIE